jgi:hypothetical protein
MCVCVSVYVLILCRRIHYRRKNKNSIFLFYPHTARKFIQNQVQIYLYIEFEKSDKSDESDGKKKTIFSQNFWRNFLKV